MQIPTLPLCLALGTWSYSYRLTSTRQDLMAINHLGSIGNDPRDLLNNIVLVRVQNTAYYSDTPLVLGNVLHLYTFRHLTQEFSLHPHILLAGSNSVIGSATQLILSISHMLLSITIVIDLTDWAVNPSAPVFPLLDPDAFTTPNSNNLNYATTIGIGELDRPGLLGTILDSLTLRSAREVSFCHDTHRTIQLVLRTSRLNHSRLTFHSRCGEYAHWPAYVGTPSPTPPFWPTSTLFPGNTTPPFEAWNIPIPVEIPLLQSFDDVGWTENHNVVMQQLLVLPEAFLEHHTFTPLELSMTVARSTGLPNELLHPFLPGPSRDPWDLRDNRYMVCLVRTLQADKCFERRVVFDAVLNYWTLNDLVYLPEPETGQIWTMDDPMLDCIIIITSPTFAIHIIVDLPHNDPILHPAPTLVPGVSRLDRHTNRISFELSDRAGFLAFATKGLRMTHIQNAIPAPQGRNYIGLVVTSFNQDSLRVTTGWNLDMTLLPGPYHATQDPVLVTPSFFIQAL